MTSWLTVPSPLGDLLLTSDGASLTSIRFLAVDPGARLVPAASEANRSGVLLDAADQLAQYFSGARTAFDLPLRPSGTPFQVAVWTVLATIPYASTWTYGRLATALGRPAASRAVGGACGRNPLPVVVPCHRVIGSDGSLTGYAGGTWIKHRLLTLEERSGRRMPATATAACTPATAGAARTPATAGAAR